MLAKLSRADMIGGMPGYKTGAETRRKILLALLEDEPRTVRGLAEVCGLSNSGMRDHVKLMRRDGLLAVSPRAGRLGSSVTLTPAGKEAAKLL